MHFTLTQCYSDSYIVFSFQSDKPWLWARFDRKPNKGAEKRFKKFQSQQQKLRKEAGDQSNREIFPWDFEKDFKVSISK